MWTLDRHPQACCGGCHVSNGRSAPKNAGISLLEIMVVVAIIGILIAIGVPSLAMARSSAYRAHCASNQRQVFMAAGMYGADHRSYLGQADALDYQTSSSTNNGKPLPGQFIRAGFNNPLTRQGDHYLALGYMPITTTYQNQPGQEALLCPGARHSFSAIKPTYWQDIGNVESHFFFSTLLSRPTTTSSLRKTRNNIWGPYKASQIKNPQATFLAGDAVGFNEPSATQTQMVDLFNWENVGQRSTAFGVKTHSGGLWLDNPPPYHPGGPNGLGFDGHVQTVLPPAPSNRYALRKHFTADFSGEKK